MTYGATDVLTIPKKKKKNTIAEREECIRCQSTEQCWTKSTGLGGVGGKCQRSVHREADISAEFYDKLGVF